MIKTRLIINGIISTIFNRKIMANTRNSIDPRNWEEAKDGKICLQNIEITPTPTWMNGWYKNPSSGRSINYGLNVENSQEHSTVIVKGGCFFIDPRIKKTLYDNSIFMNELYGSISIKAAKREYEIALLIQKRFESLLHKKANCPQPLDCKVITHIESNNKYVEIGYYFGKTVGEEENRSKFGFTITNFFMTAAELGVDIMYPLSEEAENEIKRNPYPWLISQCLEKVKPGIYRYKIDGPNTRIIDLMTLPLCERLKYFMKANNAVDILSALKNFSSKLGEYYGLLHKVGIGYHAGYSEHCTLIDTTISGVVMDIGGLSEDTSCQYDLEGYIVQVMNTINLLRYLCENILKIDSDVFKNVIDIFWAKYKSLYWDNNLKYLAEDRDIHKVSRKIRTRYVDSITGHWIQLAPDLMYLST